MVLLATGALGEKKTGKKFTKPGVKNSWKYIRTRVCTKQWQNFKDERGWRLPLWGERNENSGGGQVVVHMTRKNRSIRRGQQEKKGQETSKQGTSELTVITFNHYKNRTNGRPTARRVYLPIRQEKGEFKTKDQKKGVWNKDKKQLALGSRRGGGPHKNYQRKQLKLVSLQSLLFKTKMGA